MNISTYKEAVSFLESLSNLAQKNTYSRNVALHIYRERMLFFLNILGNPQKKMKYIHIGGTSGKGSTTTMCQSILSQAGYKTGMYRSPHVSTFVERIQIGDKFISQKQFITLTKEIKTAVEKYIEKSPYTMLSYVEIIFCMALLHFKNQKCDYAVIEVSCGGRCDLTNIIPTPKITVITNIGHDHLDILGPTLSDVAREKAGIIKKGTTFFTTEKNKRYLKIFEHECKKVKASYNIISEKPKIISEQANSSTFTYEGNEYAVFIPGRHQVTNALLAIEVAKALNIDKKTINKGLKNLFFAGRFELIQENPIVIIDTAHNEEKLKTTAETLTNLYNNDSKSKTWLIISFTEGKKPYDMLKHIIPISDKVYVTRHLHVFRKAQAPKDVFDAIKKINPKLKPQYKLDPFEALEEVLKKASINDKIVITGSTYMAGELRKFWYPETYILQKRSMK